MDANRNIIIAYEYGSINGGSAKIAIQTALGLSSRGYNVIFFCACGPVDDELLNSGCRVVCLNQYDILSNPSRIQAVIQGIWNRDAYVMFDKLLAELGGDKPIVHIHGYSHILSASIIKACMKHRIEPYVTLHDYFSICPNGGLYNFQSDKICNKRPMSLACILCNCDSRNYIQKCYRVIRQLVQDRYIRYNKKIRYIYITEFSFSKVKKYLKSKHFYFVHNPIEKMEVDKISGADKVFYIGRLSPEKGIELFCEATEKSSCDVVVVGDGVLKEGLIVKYPTIDFVGWKNRTEIQELLANAKCLVFPSKLYETDGLIVQECLSAGIPCVVSDKCAASDYIVDGENGFLFLTNNIDDLRKKIEECNFITVNELQVTMIDEYLNNLIFAFDNE